MPLTKGAARKIAIITVNYRAAGDTIECLESIEKTGQEPYIVVVDNNSQDGSFERFREWAAEHPRMKGEVEFREISATPTPLSRRVTFIESATNGGFASGNNIGLRQAAATPGVDLLWLLNNDTTVDEKAVEAICSYFVREPDIGMAGTQLRLYHEPDRFQLLNGMTFSKVTGAARGVHAGSLVHSPLEANKVIGQTDFVCGASLIMSRNFFEAVGYLEERFFLYYEEVDLAYRGRKFPFGYVEDAVVYHKEGASAGSASQLSQRARSPLSEYHHIRSKMIFARKHIPWAIPLYFAQNIIIWLRRLARRQGPQARAVLNAILGRSLDG